MHDAAPAQVNCSDRNLWRRDHSYEPSVRSADGVSYVDVGTTILRTGRRAVVMTIHLLHMCARNLMLANAAQ